ncbi:uncharacterized protein LOC135357773 [Latimeria chalumnae]|uniref:uncharacterized protein LOC135357773 n=1 Tax=Latimeria chalumnae TaxID=7897 RepID=UPI00313B66EE
MVAGCPQPDCRGSFCPRRTYPDLHHGRFPAGVGSKVVQGLWSEEESRLHINLLELRAVRCALARLLHKVSGSRVLLRMDNTTVVCYVNRQGGTRSPALCWEAELLWNWALSHQVDLRAVHLAGKDNVLADTLSRDLVDPHEWFLNQQIVDDIVTRWGVPDVDLFASTVNTKVPRFWSQKKEPGVSVLDALSNKWPAGLLYAFPPIPLIPRVIGKLRKEGGQMILIVPHWPRPGLVSGIVVPPTGTGSSSPALGQHGVSERRPSVVPEPTVSEPPCLDPEERDLDLVGMSQGVREILLGSRKDSTRKAYNLKWKLFSFWCAGRQLDPFTCSVNLVLEYLLSLSEGGLQTSLVRVHLAAISAFHARVGGSSFTTPCG